MSSSSQQPIPTVTVNLNQHVCLQAIFTDNFGNTVPPLDTPTWGFPTGQISLTPTADGLGALVQPIQAGLWTITVQALGANGQTLQNVANINAVSSGPTQVNISTGSPVPVTQPLNCATSSSSSAPTILPVYSSAPVTNQSASMTVQMVPYPNNYNNNNNQKKTNYVVHNVNDGYYNHNIAPLQKQCNGPKKYRGFM
jgi:hypothetical protein